jgi:hypothetical protein
MSEFVEKTIRAKYTPCESFIRGALPVGVK